MKEITVEALHSAAYTVPTESPESDGTLTWDSTTIIIVEARAAGQCGLGYTYGPAAVHHLIQEKLSAVVTGSPALDVGAAWTTMRRELRNAGFPGIGAMAISAVDIALWDLKARLLGIPLVVALDAVHESLPLYGSGGFTSYSDEELADQLAGWVQQGIPAVKMKVGRDPENDPHRVAAARAAIGDRTGLFVDANGAYSRKQALSAAHRFTGESAVVWFEEPVTSDDLDGLRVIRDNAPPGLEIAAGEYGYTLPYFARMLAAGAVDCLQADVTRCGGITAFRKIAALCDAHAVDLSAHCAPQASVHAAAAVTRFRHIEYFHDHIRLERLLFDGVLEPANGTLIPDRSRPGTGLRLKDSDAASYLVT